MRSMVKMSHCLGVVPQHIVVPHIVVPYMLRGSSLNISNTPCEPKEVLGILIEYPPPPVPGALKGSVIVIQVVGQPGLSPECLPE